MPAPVEGKDDKAEQMWSALKRHIIRERERKKQEREAEVEEERLRKEREAREQQDVMTLGETREQISQLEAKLTQLKEEKHQLFLQLKKVLNEDDNRRRQLVKENESLISIQTLPMGAIVHQPIYMPQNIPRGAAPSMAGQPQLLQQQQQLQQQGGGFKVATVKRQRSPSPPPAALMASSMYHQSFGYKGPGVLGGGGGGASFQPSPQKEDNRRHDARAVLWNKTAQYSTQPSSAAAAAAAAAAAFYPHDLQLYSRGEPPPPPPGAVRTLYEQHPRVPLPQQQQQQQQQQSYHMEQQQQQQQQQGGGKGVLMDTYAEAMRVSQGVAHVIREAQALTVVQQQQQQAQQVAQQQQQQQSPIKNNYPMRGSPYQQQVLVLGPGGALHAGFHGPTAAATAAASRLYQSGPGGPVGGAPLNYPPQRD